VTLLRQPNLFRDCPKCDHCAEYDNCGGCHVQCKAGDCLRDFSECDSCVSICCLHPRLSQYLADIQGTGFPSFSQYKINYPLLPGVIPLLNDPWDAEEPYPYRWVAVGPRLLYNKSGLKLDFLKDLHANLKIPKATQIILVNHGEDWRIEDYWRNAFIMSYIEALANANIVLATGFNYSLFDEHARMMPLISMKKSRWKRLLRP